MKIVKSNYYKPESDGDVRFEISVDVENKKEEIVELSMSSVIITDGKDNALAIETEREEQSYAEKGETFNIDLSPWGAKDYHFDDIKKAKAIVDITTYKREFMKLGEFDCPEDHNSVIKSDEAKEFGKLRVFGIIIARQEPPEDPSDDHYLTIKVIVKNLSDEFIQKIMCKVKVEDRQGENIQDGEDYRTIAPNACMVLEPGISAKSGKLKGSKIAVSVSSYHEMEHFNGESLLKLTSY